MSRSWRSVLAAAAIGAALLGPAAGVAGAQAAAVSSQSYDELFAQYLDAARKTSVPHSLWMADLATDPRAHRVNDLLTLKVEESITASGTADASVTKSSAAQASLPSPLSKALGKALPASSDTKFAGAGSTSRAGDITALMTARVTEVLPNGDLAIEAVREIDINNDRQIVVLTGVVRPLDVTPQNLVSSTEVGQLRIRYLGGGLIKDSLSPGWLIRLLNKIF